MSRRRALLCITYTTDISEMPYNEIWYTNGSTTEPTEPYKPAAFGDATIQSNTYDTEKECWVIKFDKDVTEIGQEAFSGCISLTSVTIPDSVTTIGTAAFIECTSLTSITIPDGVTSIGWSAFENCDSLTSVTIPDSVTTIIIYAFAYCTSLTSFYGKFASEDNRCLIVDGKLIAFAPVGLTEYTIPDSVTTIGSSAFSGCNELTSVSIPDSVTTIGSSAFMFCDSLTSVYCKPTTPPTGNSSMFNNNASDRKIYVPYQSLVAYKTATNWSNYADAIVGYDFENDTVV